jgi:hypothetical protein
VVHPGFCLSAAEYRRAPSSDATHSGQIAKRTGSVDRAGIGRCICGRSSPDAPLSWTDLIRII